MKVAVPQTRNILAPLGITAAASAIDIEIQKKIHGSGRPSSSASRTTTLIISNKKMNDIMKIVEALEDFVFYQGEAPEDSNILFKGVTETIKNETEEQKGEFFKYVIRHFRSQFVRKHVSRERYCKSWFQE